MDTTNSIVSLDAPDHPGLTSFVSWTGIQNGAAISSNECEEIMHHIDDENAKKKNKQGILSLLKREDSNLAMTLFFIGAAIFFIGLMLGQDNLDNISNVTYICAVISCSLITAAGVIVIIRKEAPRPGFRNIKGIGAVLSGLLVILTFGLGGIILLVLLIRGLLSR